MLNKNQSKKWNSWKYVLIVPVLVAFMFYFQIKVIAQERSNPEVETLVKGSEDIVINKNTTDAQLKEYAEQFKQQYGVKLKFSKVKRNSAGEIISLKAQYNDKNKQSGTWQMNGDEPIKPMRLTRKSDGSIAFGNNKQLIIEKRGRDEHKSDAADRDNEESYSYSYSTDEDGESEVIINGQRIAIPEPPELAELPELEDLPEMPTPPNGTNVIVKTIKNKDGKMVVTVNGEVINIDTDKILAEIDINLEDVKRQAREGARMAREQSRIARREASIARQQAGEAANDSEDVRRDIENSRRDMEESRRQMEENRREMEQARRELEKERAELMKERSEMKAKSKSAKTTK